MSPETQRIAIAEACGTKLIEAADGWWDIEHNGKLGTRGVYKSVLVQGLPDYLNDLNAMHEAEEVLSPPPSDRLTDASTHSKDWLEYSNQLAWVCPMGTWIRATAAQRAEALLRTLGKWEDKG